MKILLVFCAIGGFLDPWEAYILDGAFPFVGTTGSDFLRVGLYIDLLEATTTYLLTSREPLPEFKLYLYFEDLRGPSAGFLLDGTALKWFF